MTSFSIFIDFYASALRGQVNVTLFSNTLFLHCSGTVFKLIKHKVNYGTTLAIITMVQPLAYVGNGYFVIMAKTISGGLTEPNPLPIYYPFSCI